MRHIHRVTTWAGSSGVMQVEAAVLDADTWEPLAHAVESVGPFDSALERIEVALHHAINLADGQYPGQLTLTDPVDA